VTKHCDIWFQLWLSYGLVSDHLSNALDELGACVATLLSALLVHGFAPEDMSSCTLILIPKAIM